MTTFLFIAGAIAGAIGGFISVVVVVKKYALKLDERNEPVGMALGVCVAACAAAGAGLVNLLAAAGESAQLLGIMALAPFLVGGLVFVLNFAPRVRNSVDRLTDWLVTLTVVGPSKEQVLQKRVEELEATVRNMQGPETQS